MAELEKSGSRLPACQDMPQHERDFLRDHGYSPEQIEEVAAKLAPHKPNYSWTAQFYVFESYPDESFCQSASRACNFAESRYGPVVYMHDGDPVVIVPGKKLSEVVADFEKEHPGKAMAGDVSALTRELESERCEQQDAQIRGMYEELPEFFKEWVNEAASRYFEADPAGNGPQYRRGCIILARDAAMVASASKSPEAVRSWLANGNLDPALPLRSQEKSELAVVAKLAIESLEF